MDNLGIKVNFFFYKFTASNCFFNLKKEVNVTYKLKLIREYFFKVQCMVQMLHVYTLDKKWTEDTHIRGKFPAS